MDPAKAPSKAHARATRPLQIKRPLSKNAALARSKSSVYRPVWDVEPGGGSLL